MAEEVEEANWQRGGKPIWAAKEWKDIATRVERLPVKVRHVDAHIPKSRANEEHRNNEQVLLTSYTVVRTQEKGWTHITRVKGPVPPPNTGPDPAETSTSLPEWVAILNSSNLKVTSKRKKPPVG
ncbi:hypothetical protein DUI87_27100 [Hirundo rustica rustica]|uniref:RNase H type-1 domain-containing protein n=1 Tax=Hirundo rustica rustica TaxID=333673 RepID=A0A3M0J6E4_HIRRU|nr:hypothetical protein DUI87_27100 [Hirundo rustica rustica]